MKNAEKGYPMKYKMSAVLFAGGKSSRMGEDKALLPFGSYGSLSEFQYRKLSKLFETVHICAKNAKFDFECQVIEDLYEVHSPLAGLISIFETLNTDEIFVLSVDTPFIDEHIIKELITARSEGYDAIIAKGPRGIEPLCGIYRRSILPLAKENFSNDRHKLLALLESAHTNYVNFEDEHAFANLNYPHEYQEALGKGP